MASKLNWKVLAIAIIFGVALGTTVAIIGNLFGLPSNLVPVLTGAITGGMVPVFYRLYLKRSTEQAQ
jgi:uncharacterized membrane protein YjjP (DUF1212 family)